MKSLTDWITLCNQQQTEINGLRRQVAELRADAARLDWLQREYGPRGIDEDNCDPILKALVDAGACPNLRAAIDAAREAK